MKIEQNNVNTEKGVSPGQALLFRFAKTTQPGDVENTILRRKVEWYVVSFVDEYDAIFLNLRFL